METKELISTYVEKIQKESKHIQGLERLLKGSSSNQHAFLCEEIKNSEEAIIRYNEMIKIIKEIE